MNYKRRKSWLLSAKRLTVNEMLPLASFVYITEIITSEVKPYSTQAYSTQAHTSVIENAWAFKTTLWNLLDIVRDYFWQELDFPIRL